MSVLAVEPFGLDIARLETCLRRRLSDSTIRVKSVSQFSRGISRETWSVECAHGRSDTNVVHRILRRDLPNCSIVPTSLLFEYEVYRKLGQSDVPAARAIFYEDDPDLTPDSRPFYMREEVEGDWEIPDYHNPDPRFAQLRVQIAMEHLRKLAMVHNVNWRALGFDEIMSVPADESDCGRSAVSRNLAMLRSWAVDPDPVITEASEWLVEHAPPASRISLLKGTNGIGEEIFRGTEIVAMSDWEQSSLGDPACDLARAQDVTAPVLNVEGARIWGLEEALAYYRQLTGIEVRTETIDYYQTLVALENSVALAHGTKMLREGRELSAKVAWLSTEIAYYGRRQLLASVVGARRDSVDKFLNTQS